VRRNEIVEVIEVNPLTVPDVQADREEQVATEPASQPQPVRA
jgi:hypothetical protein